VSEALGVEQAGPLGVGVVQAEGVMVGHPPVATVVHDEERGVGGEGMMGRVVALRHGLFVDVESPAEPRGQACARGGVEAEVSGELREEGLGTRRPGDRDDRRGRNGRPRDGQGGEGAERVPDDRGEGAVPVLQLLGGVDPVADVGAPPGRRAVGRGIEREDVEPLGDELPHEGRELRGASAPSVQEQRRARPGAPLVRDDLDAAHRESSVAGVGMGGSIRIAHRHPR